MSKREYTPVRGHGMGWTDPRVDMREHPDALVRRILKGEVPPEIRAEMVQRVVRHDTYISQANWMGEPATTDMHDDNIYRVSVFPDGIDILCFGLASIDSNIDGHYDQTDDLPNWVKERLAVLMITSGIPPTQEVAGIGRRISSHVYWVYAPERT